MDLILSVGIIMIWVAVVMILYMTYLGFDVRSRGFKASGPAFLTLSKLEIPVREYYRKRGQHPVIDENTAKRTKRYFLLTVLSVIVVIAVTITVFVV